MEQARTILASSVLALTTLSTQAQLVAWVEMEGTYVDRPDPYGWIMGQEGPTLLDVVRTFEDIASDASYDALVLRFRSPMLTSTQIEEIGAALQQVRESGKSIFTFSEIYTPGEMLLASHADTVIMQSGGAVSFPGIYMEEMFLAETLEWIGIEPSYVQIGDYKGAKEMMDNSQPSPAWEQNISGLLDSLYATMRTSLKRGRHLSDRQLDDAMDMAFYMNAENAIRKGMIDVELDRMDLHAYLKDTIGEDIEYDTSIDFNSSMSIDFANPFAFLAMLSAEPDHTPRRDTIAVLHIDGAIVDGESSPGSLFGGASVGALTIRESLRDLESDDNVKGVIVRINSPGGSAIASENIWQGVRRVAEHKPVWVSVGSMAASGGYYIAVSGEKIYMNPSSIIGSIGVVGGKLAMGDLYEKLHINVVPRARGPRASLMSGQDAWNEEEERFIAEMMTETYDLFVERVESGRSGIDIDKTAEGRLFLSDRALDLRMADEVGGLSVAVDDMAEDLTLVDGEYDVMHFPGPGTLDEFLDSMLGFGVRADARASGDALSLAIGSLRLLVGERAWPSVSASLEGAMQMRREPVLLMMPRVLMFK
ncbi:MAG: signal peptide peptidase SppA [Phycisphaerales bacterium JB043]